MLKSKKNIIGLSVGFALVFPFCSGAAIMGSCESSARSISSGTTSVELVLEYDEDSGQYSTSNYVYYCKTTLRRLTEYTVWLEDTDGKLIQDGSIRIDSVYPADSSGDTFPATASFWTSPVGNMEYFWLPKDEWTYDPSEPEFNDPASWPYYIAISGVKGKKAHLQFKTGLHLPEGIYDNPVMVTPMPNETGYVDKTDKGDNEKDHKLRGGEFFITTPMKKSRKYLFTMWSEKSAPEEEISFEVQGDGRANPFTDPRAPKLDSKFTAGWTSYVPFADDDLETFPYTTCRLAAMTNAHVQVKVIEGGKTNLVWTNMLVNAMSSTANFRIAYSIVPDRTLLKHNPGEIALGGMQEFETGHLANPAYFAYDDIIDDNLFKFSVKKDKRYVLSTEDAQTNLLMRVYDANGTIVFENTGAGNGYDCRIAFVAEKTTDYYVGVCENLEDDDLDTPLGKKVKLLFESAEGVDGEPDEWDAGDDVHGGASGLTVWPGKNGDLPTAVDKDGHGPHQLGKTDWIDTFMIGGRKGLTYHLKLDLPEGAGQNRNTLGAVVFTASGKKTYWVDSRGDINPGSTTGLTFKASANATYYVQLYVNEGYGYDYPKYRVHAVGYDDDGTEYGILRVSPKGAASATWKIDSESVKYPAGASILVKAGAHKITYTEVSGFAAPAKRDIAVKAGELTSVDSDFYTDKYDPKDDACGGKGVTKAGKSVTYAATAWKLKNSETVQERTLWHDDPADNFSFSASAGCYYDFSIVKVNLTNEQCDAVYAITNASGFKCEAVGGIIHQLQLPVEKTKYFLTVSHENPDEARNNGSYALTGYYKNPGYVKFGKTAVTVKDNAASVKLAVKRTQKDGRIRVRYETLNGSAVAGTNYVAQAGELVWEDGDKKDKTITVKLIPKLRSFYEGGTVLDFQVKLFTLPEDELEYEEYPTKVQLSDKAKTLVDEDFATVTITESANKKILDPMDNYTPVKAAKVKTEVAALRAGTFYGVLAAPVAIDDGDSPSGEARMKPNDPFLLGVCTNASPALAAVHLPEGSCVVNGRLAELDNTDAVTNYLHGAAVTNGVWADWYSLGSEAVELAVYVWEKRAVNKYTGESEWVSNHYCVAEIGTDPYADAQDGESEDGETEYHNFKWELPLGAFEGSGESLSVKTQEVTSVIELTGGAPALTNGYPALASVTVTVAAKNKSDLTATDKDSLSASVTVAGKKYSFKTVKGEPIWDVETPGRKVKKLRQVVTVNRVKYTNTLEIAICDGLSTKENDWAQAAAGTNRVTLTMNVPDAKNKSVQAGIVYRGEVFRSNAKIQDYLTAVTNFAGYYTMGLVPPKRVIADTGVPRGNGYLCVTIATTGKVKVTGKLVDGSAVSLSATAVRLVPDATSANGYSLYVPVFYSKKPYCFGGVLRFFAEETLDYDGVNVVVVVKVDSGSGLAWYNDNAALTYDNMMGFAYGLSPVGGYYDTVINLQSYYINSELKVDTTGVESFPAEMFTYTPVSTQEANGFPVDVNLNAFALAKKSLVKDKETKLYDFEESSNPANVQIKLARATGLISGSFSIWTEGYKGETFTQKNVTGPKHYGVMLLSRDNRSYGDDTSEPALEPVFPAENISAGFFNTKVKVVDPNTNKSRNWTFSGPFNLKDTVEVPVEENPADE